MKKFFIALGVLVLLWLLAGCAIVVNQPAAEQPTEQQLFPKQSSIIPDILKGGWAKCNAKNELIEVAHFDNIKVDGFNTYFPGWYHSKNYPDIVIAFLDFKSHLGVEDKRTGYIKALQKKDGQPDQIVYLFYEIHKDNPNILTLDIPGMREIVLYKLKN